jgi:hypothetical protein
MWASPNLAGVRQERRGVTGTEQEVPTLPDGYKIAPAVDKTVGMFGHFGIGQQSSPV